MATALMLGAYAAIGLLIIIFVMAMINLTKTDEGQPTRSNQLMRARVIVQAVIVALLVLLGIVVGSINLF
ncbi:MAG: HIG1 domain-containing protein [Pseudomonadota bacterium]